MKFKTLSISLTPEHAQLIEEQLKSGRYDSESEVIREALELLQKREYVNKMRLEKLRQEVAIGIEQLDRGEGIDGEAVFEEILEEIRQAKESEG